MLFLKEHDVEELIDMSVAVDVMEGAFRALAAGTADNSPRVRVKASGIILHSMSAAAEYLGLVGWKQYTTTRQGAKFLVGLYCQSTGDLIAMIEADRLGQVRTGAVSGLAAKLLALPGTDEVGLIGTGWQAEGQLAAVAAALPLRRARVYGRNSQRRDAFADRMSKQLGIEIVACDHARQAVEDLRVVVTATNSREPVLFGDWLADGTLVCAMGSNRLQSAEVDTETVRRANHVVCDDVLCCQREAGELVQAAAAGAFDWNDAVGLATVLGGDTVRREQSDIVLFKSVGMAIEDVAIGGHLVDLAKKANIGVRLPIGVAAGPQDTSSIEKKPVNP